MKPSFGTALKKTASYQYEYPWEQDSYRFQYRGADAANYCPSPFKPETQESAPQCEVIERLIRTMNEAPDQQFEESISQYLDIRAFLKEMRLRHISVKRTELSASLA